MLLLSLVLTATAPAATGATLDPAVAVYTAKLAAELNGHATDLKELEKFRKKAPFRFARQAGAFEAVGEQLCVTDGIVRYCWGPERSNGALGLKFDGLDGVFVPTSRDERKFRAELGRFLQRSQMKPQATSFWQRLFVETAEAFDPESAYHGPIFTWDNRESDLAGIYGSYLGWYQMPREKINGKNNAKYYGQLADLVSGRSFAFTSHDFDDLFGEGDKTIIPADVKGATRVTCRGNLATFATKNASGSAVVAKATADHEFRVSLSGLDVKVSLEKPVIDPKACEKVLATGKADREERHDDGQRYWQSDSDDQQAQRNSLASQSTNTSSRKTITTIDEAGMAKTGPVGWFGKDYYQFRVCRVPVPAERVHYTICANEKCDEPAALSPNVSENWARISGFKEEDVKAYRKLMDDLKQAKSDADSFESNPPSGMDGATLSRKLDQKQQDVENIERGLTSNPLNKICQGANSFDDCLRAQGQNALRVLSRLSLRTVAAGKCCGDTKCRIYMYQSEGGLNFQDEVPGPDGGTKAQ
jgi:hypothetical protein